MIEIGRHYIYTPRAEDYRSIEPHPESRRVIVLKQYDEENYVVGGTGGWWTFAREDELTPEE